MKKLIPIAIILSLIIVACYVAPNPIFRLQTVENDNEKFWLHGKEYTRLIANNTEVIIAFDGVASNRIAFEVEILNNDSASIIVSPESFVAYYLDENKQPLGNIAKQNAIDPEEEILELDKALSRENARYAQENGTKGLLSLFDLASDIATIGEPKTESEIREEEQEYLERQIEDEEDENFHANVETDLSYKKEKWESAALRKTTLPSDCSVGGKIVFPFKSYCKYMKIIFDEGKDNQEIVFKINKFASN